MEKYIRTYPKLSLCGLNCGLCPMYHIQRDSKCPGCGGINHQSCHIKTCASQHGGIQYCYECQEYPCAKYDGWADYDSFISHKNAFSNFEKLQVIGLKAYQVELDRKVEILSALLERFNDGRRKTFYSQAINLLDLEDVLEVMERIEEAAQSTDLVKERAAIAVKLLQDLADKRNVTLKLNRRK